MTRHGWDVSDHNGKDHYHDESGIAMYFDDNVAGMTASEIDHREGGVSDLTPEPAVSKLSETKG